MTFESKHFPGVVVMITIEIAVIYLLIWLRNKYRPLPSNRLEKTYFEMSGTHLLSERKEWNLMLCGFRIGAFFYFFIVAWIMNWAAFGADAVFWYFTHWNLVLLSIYFLCASICSVVYLLAKSGYISDPPFQDVVHPLKDYPNCFGPSNFFERFAKNVARTHDVAGACALFITVVNFGVLDSSSEYYNVVNHLTNSIFMGFELLNNNIEATMESYKWVVTWIWVFIIFTWSMVSSGTKPWPYFFLNTDSGGAYAWYEGLFILNFVFFMIWYWCSHFKFVAASHYKLISFNWFVPISTKTEVSAVDSTVVEMGAGLEVKNQMVSSTAIFGSDDKP